MSPWPSVKQYLWGQPYAVFSSIYIEASQDQYSSKGSNLCWRKVRRRLWRASVKKVVEEINFNIGDHMTYSILNTTIPSQIPEFPLRLKFKKENKGCLGRVWVWVGGGEYVRRNLADFKVNLPGRQCSRVPVGFETDKKLTGPWAMHSFSWTHTAVHTNIL